MYTGEYKLEHSGGPVDRLTIVVFPIGHMVYEGDKNPDWFISALRKFVKSALSPAAAEKTDVPVYEITMKPVRGGDGEPEAVEIRQRFYGPEKLRGDVSMRFQAPVLYTGVAGTADTFDSLQIRDILSPVSPAKTNDSADKGGFMFFHPWRSERALAHPVEMSYRARMYPTTKRKLENIFLAVIARRQAGEKIDQEKWLEAVTNEIGPGFERKSAKYSVDGTMIDGFEWARLPSVTAAACREW